MKMNKRGLYMQVHSKVKKQYWIIIYIRSTVKELIQKAWILLVLRLKPDFFPSISKIPKLHISFIKIVFNIFDYGKTTFFYYRYDMSPDLHWE